MEGLFSDMQNIFKQEDCPWKVSTSLYRCASCAQQATNQFVSVLTTLHCCFHWLY